MDAIARFGRVWLNMLERLGRAHLFLWRTLGAVASLVTRFGLLVSQLFATGVMTLSIILVSGLFVGMVLALQGYYLLQGFGAEAALGQASGLEMMAVDPFKRVYAPRFFAGFLALPMLAAMFSAVGVFGGYLVGVEVLGVDAGAYWSNMQSSVSFLEDTGKGLVKACVFGFVVSWIAIFEGTDCIPTSEGVSAATTRTVVYSSLAVLGLDFVLTAVMF